jgi:hypothetical protein
MILLSFFVVKMQHFLKNFNLRKSKWIMVKYLTIRALLNNINNK